MLKISLPCRRIEQIRRMQFENCPHRTTQNMLMTRFILLFFSFMVPLNAARIPDNFQLAGYVEVTGDRHYAGPMGNVYVVKDNTLKKFSPGRDQVANYSNAFLGNIYSVDVSDPLRIMLFFRDHNQVVWVDDFLSQIRSPVWLDDLGLDQVELVCSSSQGGFWVFNSLNNQLQYFDVNLSLVHEGPTLNILTGPDIRPTFMIEKNRSLYLNIPGTGILVFDLFGNYSRTLPVDVPLEFQVTDRCIYFMKDGELLSYDLSTAEFARLPLPVPGEPEGTGNAPGGQGKTGLAGPGNEILKAELQPGFLFLYTRKGYWIYKTNP
jgi:hypothetical protein